MEKQEYFDYARKNEAIFRSIIKDMKSRVPICPIDLDFNSPLEEIFRRYSQGNRYGKFTILNFKKGPSKGLENLAENEASISVEDIACLSGAGWTLKYKIKPDNTTEYVKCIANWMS